ncbi:MAG: phosphotransferase family protein [Gammaproteobacteria bacterium]
MPTTLHRDLPLPDTPEEITASWLTAALERGYPGVAVEAVEPGEQLWGTGTKLKFAVRYNAAGRAAGLPERLVVKGCFAPHRQANAYLYLTEARTYSEILPQAGIRVPPCFFSGTDARNLQSIVLLEDLGAAGVTFARVQQPLTFRQAADNLAEQARLHARWWNHPALEDPGALGWLPRLLPISDDESGAYGRGQLAPEVYAHYMTLPRGVGVSTKFHDRDRMQRALAALGEFDRQGPMCLLHSDAHLGNMYFTRDGAPGFLDWQCPRIGPWSHDVVYFIVSALDIADRRHWDAALLQHYLGCLAGLGVAAPSFEEAWEAYRRQIVYGLFYWLVNPVEWQVEVNNCAVASRFAIAALDVGSYEALGV